MALKPPASAYSLNYAHFAESSLFPTDGLCAQDSIDPTAPGGYSSGPKVNPEGMSIRSGPLMTRKQHVLILLALMGLATMVQVLVTRRATVTGLDTVRFVGIAKAIDRDGILPVIRTEREHCLFPVWLWAVHEALERVIGASRLSWGLSAQLAAAIPLVVGVVPLYLMILRLIGSAAAVAGCFFYCLLPEVARMGADGISDSSHMLLFIVAFWAMVEYLGKPVTESSGSVAANATVQHVAKPPGRRLGSPCWLLLAGAAAAMAVLARMEILVLVAAFWLVLILFQSMPGRRRPWPHLATAGGCFAIGLAIILGPYLAAVDSLTPHQALARLLGRHEVENSIGEEDKSHTQWRLAGGEPMAFAVREPNISIRQRGIKAAVILFGKKLADAMGYWIGALALFGAARLRRGRPSDADRFIQVFFAVFALVVIGFSAAEGYLTTRHLVPLVVAGIASAGFGAVEFGRWLSDLTAGWRRGPGIQDSGLVWSCGVVLLAGTLCLPQTLMHLHFSRLGYRQAAQWLATEADTPGKVLDTLGWTGLYSGRDTYGFERARAALEDRQLAYIVLERRELGFDSVRSRTLRCVLRVAGEPIAEFPAATLRRPNQRPVLVYRWYPDRFFRFVASRTAEVVTKEDRCVQASAGVRR